jgi:hypothetical protein
MRAARLACAMIAMLGVATAEARSPKPVSRTRTPATTLRVETAPRSPSPWRADAGRLGGVTRAGGLPGAERRGEWATAVVSPRGVGLESSLVFLAMLSAQGRARPPNGPPCDGLSLREQRPHDQSGLLTLPVLVGRF